MSYAGSLLHWVVAKGMRMVVKKIGLVVLCGFAAASASAGRGETVITLMRLVNMANQYWAERRLIAGEAERSRQMQEIQSEVDAGFVSEREAAQARANVAGNGAAHYVAAQTIDKGLAAADEFFNASLLKEEKQLGAIALGASVGVYDVQRLEQHRKVRYGLRLIDIVLGLARLYILAQHRALARVAHVVRDERMVTSITVLQRLVRAAETALTAGKITSHAALAVGLQVAHAVAGVRQGPTVALMHARARAAVAGAAEAARVAAGGDPFAPMYVDEKPIVDQSSIVPFSGSVDEDACCFCLDALNKCLERGNVYQPTCCEAKQYLCTECLEAWKPFQEEALGHDAATRRPVFREMYKAICGHEIFNLAPVRIGARR